ncbi:MAG: efflux RND transporter periplasmic adaptor subunit [Verrucomicrobia bacterium]|nr:efflux RND transporter periplasmic adaptor subunit [Verrucomicrobiota bacterium]MDE3099931.1 efflux RND transporter periplasmic adaptor subunit [Verrucomicrobiota bacterium]
MPSFRQTWIVMAAVFAAATLAARAEAIEVSGITEPLMDVTIGLADPGIIHRQFFNEGDFVKKGDVILELDKQLETLEVARRKAVMDEDKMILDSTRQLAETTKSVSKEDLAKAQADYDVAAAQYGTAVQQLADRQLVAPFSGFIVKVLLRPGAPVAPYQPLVRLVDTSRCYFIGHLPGPEAGNLRLDEPVTVALDGGRTVSGKICFISPVVDAASGLARIKAIFDNVDGKIRPGVAAKLTVP